METDSREDEPLFNRLLTQVEEQVRRELKDGEATLTRSASAGRLQLEIQEELLVNFLQELQRQRKEDEWRQETERLQMEIRCLNVQLQEAKLSRSPQAHIEELKSQLRNISMRDPKDLKQLTSNITDLQIRLEETRKENEALQKDLEEVKVHFRAEKLLRAAAERNLETTSEYLKVQFLDRNTAAFEACSKVEELEKHLALERTEAWRLHWKLSKAEDTLLNQKEEAEKTLKGHRVSHKVQLEAHRAENSKITAAVKKAKGLLEAEHRRRHQEQTSFQEARDSCGAQLEEQKYENFKLMCALREVEEQLMADHHKWERVKASLLEELHEAGCRYEALLTDVRMAEYQLERDHLQWQKEKLSLLQATEELQQCLQEKEQLWETAESFLKSQLEDRPKPPTGSRRRSRSGTNSSAPRSGT